MRYNPFTIQMIYIHLLLNSAPLSIIIQNSTLGNRQTEPSLYGNLDFLGYISHRSFMFIVFPPTGEKSRTLIWASGIRKSWSFIRASILSNRKVQGYVSPDICSNEMLSMFLHGFSFPFSGLLIFVFVFSWFQNWLYQIPKTGIIFCHCSHWSIVLFCLPSGTSSSSRQRGEEEKKGGAGEERGSRCRGSIHEGTDPQQGFKIGLDTQTRKRSHLTFPLEIPMQIELILKTFFTHTDRQTHTQC